MTSSGGWLMRTMYERGLRVHVPASAFPRCDYEIIVEHPDPVNQIRDIVDDLEGNDLAEHGWREVAGTLVDAILEMDWLFKWAYEGWINPLVSDAKKCEWLCCTGCDEIQLLPAAYGAASQKRKCHMRPDCDGIMRRLPALFIFDRPKGSKKKYPLPQQPAATDDGDEVLAA